MPKVRSSSKQNLKIIVLSIIVLTIVVLVSMINSSRNFFTLPSAAPNDIVRGVGVLGDSNSDEYRANDNRGGSYASTTHGWVEQLVNYRGLNFGVWGNWGGSRRTGYKYNWARSGATTATLLGEGQHTGLAQQVNSGEVTAVFVAIGANDFAYYNNDYGRIYNGTLSGVALDSFINSVVNNITTAIDTVRQPNKAKILVATIPDSGLSPTAISRFPDAAKRQKVSDALAITNNKIKSVATDRGLPIFDTDSLATKLLSRVDAQGFVTVAGEKINFVVPGDEPHHALLGDRVHAGTVFAGIYANEWMDAMNRTLGTQLQLFTEEELLVHAGIRASASPTATPRVTASPTTRPTATATATPRVTASPTIRPTASPTIRPTSTPTARPTATAVSTPRVTVKPSPTTDPLAQYCGTYRTFRGFLLRFLTPAQIAEWDLRCGI